MHVVAAKAVCFKEAMEEGFRDYQRQVIANAKVLADELLLAGFKIASGGTDNHLMLVNVFVRGLTGSQAEKALESASITVNKNAIPFDTQPPMKASGIRIGTPALTTRGMKEADMRLIAGWISEVLADPDSESVKERVRRSVRELCDRFPIYESRLVRSRAQSNIQQ
jgi:glycine hydroxymethyltransferase